MPPSGVIVTISPGSTSRTYSAPIVSSAQVSDAKRLALYRKVQSLTKKPEKHSYLSNASFREGEYYEVLEVDGVRYRVDHVLSIEVNYFTFKPYIKKWSIDILELDS